MFVLIKDCDAQKLIYIVLAWYSDAEENYKGKIKLGYNGSN